MLHHFIVGDGPRPVLLLHGFLGSGRNLRSFARRWVRTEPDLRLVVPDLTGHGASPPLPPDPGLDDLARDVLALADALEVERPLRVVGHSLGGRVGLALARVAPDAVEEVVLLDIRPGPIEADEGTPVLARLRAAPAAFERREDARAFLVEGGVSGPVADWLVMNLEADDGTYRWRIDREALSELARRGNADDLWPVVESGRVRVRCIKAAGSPYVTGRDVTRLRAAGVPVDVIKEAGHFLHVDQPEALLACLTGVG